MEKPNIDQNQNPLMKKTNIMPVIVEFIWLFILMMCYKNNIRQLNVASRNCDMLGHTDRNHINDGWLVGWLPCLAQRTAS